LLEALAAVRRSYVKPPPFEPARSTRMFTIRTRDIGEVVFLPAIRKALAKAAPGIRIRTVYFPMEETLASLATGRIDLALSVPPSSEADIHGRPILRDHYVCVMRRGHPLARCQPTREQFLAGDHLLVEYSGVGYEEIERALTRTGRRN